MKPKLPLFLSAIFPAGSYHATLQAFLSKQQGKGVSEYTIIHLYKSLWPLGEWLHNAPVSTVTARQLKAYQEYLFLHYAPGTIRPVVGDIRQFFKWAKKRGVTAKNPAKRLTKPRPRRTQDKAADETAVAAVIAHLTGKLSHLVYRDVFGVLVCEPLEEWGETDILALRDLFVLAFLYETGGRVRELVTLGSRVMNQECATTKTAYTVTSTGKTNDRDMRFTERVAELWRVWQMVRPPGCEEYAVFSLSLNHPPAPLQSNGVSQMLARRCKEAGVTAFRSHSLRHAKVRRSRRLVGLEMASLLIDHSSVEMTRSYANIEEAEIATAVTQTGLQFDMWQSDNGRSNPPVPTRGDSGGS